jgi:hypothetical protein
MAARRWDWSACCGCTASPTGSTLPTKPAKTLSTMSPVFREFCRIDLGRERVPDATTLLHFRHLLERHDLGAALFAKIGELLLANGMKLSGGTIVDATLIAAPPSTKNQEKSRDPEMHQTKKGNAWHFGMKLHIGTDSQTGWSIAPASQPPTFMTATKCRTCCMARRPASMATAPTGARNSAAAEAHCAEGEGLHQQTRLPEQSADRGRQGDEPAQVQRAIQGRASVPDGEAPVGLCQGSLSRSGEECQPCLRHAGDAQRPQMGTTIDGRGASGMSKTRGNYPVSVLEKAD